MLLALRSESNQIAQQRHDRHAESGLKLGVVAKFK